MPLNAAAFELEPIEGILSFTVIMSPCVASANLLYAGKRHLLTMTRPQPLESLISLCDPCCCRIVVIDQNVEQGNFLEFGRFRIQMHSEDDEICRFVADKVTLEVSE